MRGLGGKGEQLEAGPTWGRVGVESSVGPMVRPVTNPRGGLLVTWSGGVTDLPTHQLQEFTHSPSLCYFEITLYSGIEIFHLHPETLPG